MGHSKHINLKNRLWNIRLSLGKTGLAHSGGGGCFSTLPSPPRPFISTSKNVMHLSDVSLFYFYFFILLLLLLLSSSSSSSLYFSFFLSFFLSFFSFSFSSLVLNC